MHRDQTPGLVHAGLIELATNPSASLLDALSREEVERAKRFRTEAQRGLFISRRYALRSILASCLGIGLDEIDLAHTELGKPYLPNWPEIAFSMSHSRELAMYALGTDIALGIDIESRDLIVDADAITRTACNKREVRAINDLNGTDRDDAILTAWVRKEAVAKAHGSGLGFPLSKIGTSPGVPADATPARVRSLSNRSWFVWDLEAPTGHRAALAANRPDVEIEFIDRRREAALHKAG
jgi:4'-phosphopantetheinyl transferase